MKLKTFSLLGILNLVLGTTFGIVLVRYECILCHKTVGWSIGKAKDFFKEEVS